MNSRKLVLCLFMVFAALIGSGLVARPSVAAPHADGELDPTFGGDGIVPISNLGVNLSDMVVLPDGKILIASDGPYDATNAWYIARFNADGSPDTTFGVAGAVRTDMDTAIYARGLAVQPDGKFIVAGHKNELPTPLLMVRYNANGSLDATFGAGGIVTQTLIGNQYMEFVPNNWGRWVALLPDGKIVAPMPWRNTYPGSTERHTEVYRFNSDGSLDTHILHALDNGFNAPVIGVDPFFGEVVYGGGNYNNSEAKGARLEKNSLFSYNGYNVPYVTFGALEQFGWQCDGKALLFGSGAAVARFTAGGYLRPVIDTTFSADGVAAIDTVYNTSDGAIQSDGKILMVGRQLVGGESLAVGRLHYNGALDTAFGSNGVATATLYNDDDVSVAIEVLPDGKILALGASYNRWSYRYEQFLARFLSTAEPPSVTPVLTLTSNLNPSVYGQNTMLMVDATSVPTRPLPSGFVQISDGQGFSTTQLFNDNEGVYSGFSWLYFYEQWLPGGANVITATYPSCAVFHSATTTMTQQVNRADTTLALAPLHPAVAGDPLPLVATLGIVSPGAGKAGDPGGWMTYTFGGGGEFTATVQTNRTAVYTLTTLPEGRYAFTATYSGNRNFNPNQIVLSPTLRVMGVLTDGFRLTTPISQANGQFGRAVALERDTLVVGVPTLNTVYIHYRNQGGPEAWGVVKTLTGAGSFGTAVALEGDMLVVGAPNAGASGQAFLYSRNQEGADAWGQVKTFTPAGISGAASFGASVAIGGGQVAVAAPSANLYAANDGAVYVYARNKGGTDAWGQEDRLGGLGNDNEMFGTALGMDGARLAVLSTARIHVFDYEYYWAETATPPRPGAATKLALSGDWLVVSDPTDSSSRGRAYLYGRTQGGENAWGQVKVLAAPSGVAGHQFGAALAMDGDSLLIGAPGVPISGTAQQGRAYLYRRTDDSAELWSAVKALIAPDGAANDHFGSAVAVRNAGLYDRLLLAAPDVDEGGNVNQGAAYLYSIPLKPNVSLAKSVFPTEDAWYHDRVTYTLVISTPTGVDRNVALTDTLPALITFDEWITRPAEATVAGDVITWRGILTAEQPVTLTFYALHLGDWEDVITNRAEFVGTEQSGSVTATFQVETPGPILRLHKTVTPTTDLRYHSELTYTLVLSNVGPLDDYQAAIADALPLEVEFARWIAQPLNGDVANNELILTGTVASGQALTVTFVVTHFGGLGDIVTNTAYFHGERRWGQAADTFTVEPPATLNVSKVGAGGGLVTSESSWPELGWPAINCPGVCAVDFVPRTVVTLTATPLDDAVFTGWSGACSGVDDCVLTLLQGADVTATFKAMPVVAITADAPDPSPITAPITVAYAVTASGAFTPTGAITLTMANDPASCVTTALTGTCILTPTIPGYNPLTLSYSGDANFVAAEDTESHLVYDPANLPVTVTLTAVAPLSPTVVGQSLVVSYTVEEVLPALGGVPTGTVVVVDNEGAACFADITAGACELRPVKAGLLDLLAIYVGNDEFQGNLDSEPHRVMPVQTRLEIVSDVPDPSYIGQPVKVYYQVAVNPPGSGRPKGNVTVADGDGNACIGAIAAGRCLLTPQQRGNKTLTGVYPGNASFYGSQGTAAHEVRDVPITYLTLRASSPARMTQMTYFTATTRTGTNIVYWWDFGDGTLPFTTTSATVTHVYQFLGVYQVTLIASNQGSQATAVRNVTVIDVPVAGLHPQLSSDALLLGERLYVTGTVAAGTNVLYEWDFGDRTPLASGETASHVYGRLGAFQLKMTAYNGVSRATVNVRVDAVQDLVGLRAAGSTPTPIGNTTFFTATVRAGSNVRFLWNFGDKTPIYETTGPVASHVYATGGWHTAIVTATNGARSISQQVRVEVIDRLIYGLSAVSNAPTAMDKITTFKASVEDGTSVVYTWDFGDASGVKVGQEVSHLYDPPTNEATTYRATVTARNTRNQVEYTTEVYIYVTPPQTRQVGAVTITGGRFHDMPDGRIRVTDGVMFANGRIRLNDNGIVYYTTAAMTFSGEVELRGGDKAFKIGRGNFSATPAGGIATGSFEVLFDQIAGWAVSGIQVSGIDLANAKVTGNASAVAINAPGVSVSPRVNSWEIAATESSLDMNGNVSNFAFSAGPTLVTVPTGGKLTNRRYSVPSVSVRMPAGVGGGTVGAGQLSLTPDQFSLYSFTSDLRGATLRMPGARLALSYGNKFLLQASGKLQATLPQNKLSLPISGIIGDDGEFAGAVDNVTLKVSGLQVILPRMALTSLRQDVGAEMGVLQLPANLGGGSAAAANVKLTSAGFTINGSSTFDLPEVRLASGKISAWLEATIASAPGGFTMEAEGEMELPVRRIGPRPKTTMAMDQAGRLSGEVEDIQMLVAFLTLTVDEMEIQPSGVLMSEKASLEYQGAKAELYNIAINASGLRIGGGGFSLPAINMGAFQLVEVGGRLIRTENGYDVGVQGGFKMANLPAQKGAPGGGPSPACTGLWVAALLSVDDAGVEIVQFMPVREAPMAIQSISIKSAQLKVFCSIPIDNTGFAITEIRGSFSREDDTVKISVGMTIGSLIEVMGINPLEAEGDVSIQFWPFEFGISAALKVFTLKIAGADARIWVHDKSRGFEGTVWLKISYSIGRVESSLSIAAWHENARGFCFTAAAAAKAVLYKGLLELGPCPVCISLPPEDLELEFGLYAGRFTNDTWGLKGKLKVLGWSVGFFVNTKGSFSLGDVDQYQLVTPPKIAQLRQRAALYGPTALEGIQLGPHDTITSPVTFGPADAAVFALARAGDHPTLILQDPAGGIITPDALPENVSYYENTLYALVGPSAAAPANARLVHAAPSAPAVIATMGAQTFASTAFGGVSDYQPVAESALVRVVRADAPNVVLAEQTLVFSGGHDYTVALLEQDGGYTLTAIADVNAPRWLDYARVRLVNLSAPETTLDLYNADGAQLAGAITYTHASDYLRVSNGTANLEVVDDVTMTSLGVITDTAAERNNIYTVFALPPLSGTLPTLVMSQDTPDQARLRVVNTGPSGAVDVWVTDESGVEKQSLANVAHAAVSEYADVTPGALTVRITPAGVAGTTLLTQTLDAVNGWAYTLLAADEGGAWTAFLLEDDVTLPESGLARVRFTNVATATALSLRAGDAIPLAASVGLNQGADYRPLPGGVYDLALRAGGQTLLTLPGAALRDGQAYSVFALPGADGVVTAVVITDLLTTKTTQTAYIVQSPQPGVWNSVLRNAAPDADYVFTVLGTSPSPKLEDVTVTHTPGDPQAQVDWRLTTYQPDTRLGIYANRDALTHTEVVTDSVTGITRTEVITDYTGLALAHNLTLTATNWITHGALQTQMVDVNHLPSGVYRVWMEVDDGRKMPVRVYASAPLIIPARPWEIAWAPVITATPRLRAFDLAWTAHPDPDVWNYAVEVSGPTFAATQVYTMGSVLEYALGALTPHQPYTLTVLAQRGAADWAHSQAVVVTPLGAPLTLDVLGGATLPLRIGEARQITVTLATPLDEYPEPLYLSADIPDGLDITLPTEMITPTLAGVQIPVWVTATEYITYGTYLLPIAAQGIGDRAAVTLTLPITRSLPHLEVWLSGAGVGRVDIAPTGLTCDGYCAAFYTPGAVVTLTAVTEPGTAFIGWTGPFTETVNPLVLTLDEALTLYAQFDTGKYYLHLPLVMRNAPQAP